MKEKIFFLPSNGLSKDIFRYSFFLVFLRENESHHNLRNTTFEHFHLNRFSAIYSWVKGVPNISTLCVINSDVYLLSILIKQNVK